MIFHKLTINRIILVFYIFAIVYLITALITGDTIKLWLSIFIGSITYSYLLIALWQRNRLIPQKGECKVILTEEAVECYFGEKKSHKMLWNDLRRVSVKKLAPKKDLPQAEVWLRLHSYPWRRVLSVPSRATDFPALFQKLSQLDEFDNEKFNEAVYAEKGVSFTLWESEDF